MSELLTREQVERMFGVGNGFKLSVWPFEIPPSSAQAFLDTDAALRKECADAQQRYETQCAGTKSRMEENQQLRQRVTELEHENKNLLTCQCEQCDNSLEEEAVCGNCYRKSQSLLENEKENVKASCQVLNEKDQQVADLTAKLAKVMEENADMKAQLTQESQDAINKQVIIDGLRSERARHTAQLAGLTAQLATVTAEWDQRKESFYADALMLRNVELLRACKECGGLGVKVYANTTTWRGGCGGQAMTNGVCDHCWGSGDRYLQWVDLRGAAQQLARFQAEIEDLRSKLQKALNH